ncbi:MAG: extracellular solute-binding protein [Propionibacteriaceae bacterium]|jgi:multiple sugar transport system substrate-binding protein|nr:extracellular solute-binding protein [Propionibacteriaceae bacterium]
MLKKRFVSALALAVAAALTAGCGGSDPDPSDSGYDPNQPVTLDLAFWGNDVRAGFYEQALAIFQDEHENITVNSSFLAFPEFWEKRQIEAVGGDLPDVMMFDYSYLRQYSENGLLLDLGPYLGSTIKTDSFSQQALGVGVVGGVTTALPIGTNAWAVHLNLPLIQQLGLQPFAGGGSWDDYNAWMTQVTTAGAGQYWGGVDWGGRIQNFELILRANGGNLFNQDGSPAFSQDDLKDFWNQTEAIRAGVVVPQSRAEEIYPKSGFGGGLAATELTWDNFGASYMGDLGVEASALALAAPPTAKIGSKDLYLKPSMMHSIAATTEHPEAAAILVDFLLNDERVGGIFGTNRGIPASATQLAGVDLDPLSQQIYDYEISVANRLGDPPPVPVVGFGTIEEKFRVLGTELGLGTISVDDAVAEFFVEMTNVLNA